MIDQPTLDSIRQKFVLLRPELDERARRCWAATEALVLGYGGITAVARATGLAHNTMTAGRAELQAHPRPAPDRIRQPGAGRKPLTTTDPQLRAALETLVHPLTRGDPESPLRWTCKSTRQLAEDLPQRGHPVSPSTVARLLQEAG